MARCSYFNTLVDCVTTFRKVCMVQACTYYNSGQLHDVIVDHNALLWFQNQVLIYCINVIMFSVHTCAPLLPHLIGRARLGFPCDYFGHVSYSVDEYVDLVITT